MITEELNQRCIECRRPLYWDDKIGSVHFNGLKFPCPKRLKRSRVKRSEKLSKTKEKEKC